ncbi:MAG: anaerobic ribonucleoside-triphosphate reductase [Lachnospiraceae bacterium]|nr:anaerobic ribonucleoside-triphosphate reductase [Lachnospiraceae bacterium]
MFVIKRDGTFVPFDKEKIVIAINKAFLEVDQQLYETDTAKDIAEEIELIIEQKNLTVEEIQDLVEEFLMRSERKDVARSYIRFRYKKEILRQTSNTYDSILKLIELENEDIKEENSNKNAIVASTQRDYMAGEVSKDLTRRFLLPTVVKEAHDAGEIHFHDADYFAQHIHNCCLVNLEDMLQNGTVINKTMIEKPHSFATACNIATQIMAVVASGQYGGQTVSLSHLAPFVDISREKIRKQVEEELDMAWLPIAGKADLIEQITEKRVKEEIKRGVQTIQYQINTLNTSNGQTPFVSINMYLGEVPEGQVKNDLALIIEEVLEQRIQGVKNEAGVWITPAFPKLLYVLEEDNMQNGKYWYLTELAAKCTAKRLVPDYISEKMMKKLKLSKGEVEGKGDCYPCMGCRSFLTPDRSGCGYDNIAKAKNYIPNTPKYYGRFNQGVVTINLVDVACSVSSVNEFWQLLNQRLDICHLALQTRHERLEGTTSDISPIHFQYGALARLEKGEKIDALLHDGYSTLSLGYAGLWECVYKLIGKKLIEPEGKELGLEIMRKLNDACAEWKAAENIDYSLYGSPIESTTYKFAKCLKKKFGIIEGVTDKDYITNSYHVKVTEPIDAFSKLAFESEFQALSPGGAISYVEVPNLNNNIEAVLEIIKFIYDNIMYAELNTKSDYCQICGFDGEIQIVEINEGNKLDWRCPQCGNMDHDKMNVARRTCGYIGANFWNQGRTEEINERVLHL